MKVCEVCGAYLLVGDTEKRSASHIEGKQHIGYDKIRKKLEELRLRYRDEDNRKPRDNRDYRDRDHRDFRDRRPREDYKRRDRDYYRDDRSYGGRRDSFPKRERENSNSDHERERERERKRSNRD
jgi:hypothetical protein